MTGHSPSQPSTADDYAYRFQYADGSAFQIYADGTAFVVFKDGRREQKFGVIDSRIQLLMGRVAKPRQDEIAALRSKVDDLTAALREIGKEVYTDGKPTKAARTASAALAIHSQDGGSPMPWIDAEEGDMS